MPTSLNRAILGCVAAVISVLVFHQGMWELLHLVGPGRDVPLSDATRAYGRAHTVAQVVARLRCQRCRRQPIDVQLIRTIDPHGAAAAIKALLAQFAAGSASTRHIG